MSPKDGTILLYNCPIEKKKMRLENSLSNNYVTIGNDEKDNTEDPDSG